MNQNKNINNSILLLILFVLILFESCKKDISNETNERINMEQNVKLSGRVYLACNGAPAVNVLIELGCDNFGRIDTVRTDSLGNYTFNTIHRFTVSNVEQAVLPTYYQYWVGTGLYMYQPFIFINNYTNYPHLNSILNDTVDFEIRKKNIAKIYIDILNPSPIGENYVEFEYCKENSPMPPYNCISYYRDSIEKGLYGEGWYDFNYKVVKDTSIVFYTDSVYISCDRDSVYHISR